MKDLQKCKPWSLLWDGLARDGEGWRGLALLEEEKEMHSAAVASLIKERQNVPDAMVWACAQRAELERTILAKVRVRQKLEDEFWQANDKYNEYLAAVHRAWEGT